MERNLSVELFSKVKSATLCCRGLRTPRVACMDLGIQGPRALIRGLGFKV